MAVIENIVAAVSDQRNDSAQEQVYLAVFGERVQCALAHQPVVCMVIDGFHSEQAHHSVKSLRRCTFKEAVSLPLLPHPVNHITALSELLYKLVEHFDIVL